jgi:hypothetical protein
MLQVWKIRIDVPRTLSTECVGGRSPDLPFEQPTKFEIVVHLKVAQSLDLMSRSSISARANQIAE